MKTSDPWQRLTTLARTAPVARVNPDPFDDARFADLVLSRRRAATTRPTIPARALPWEAWSLRGVAAAGALAAVMLAWNYPLLSADNTPSDLLPPDSVAELAEAF